MLTYEITQKKSGVGEPYYEYLYRRIREDILSGQLKPGEMLPSKRAFAKHLGLSVITVESAYGQLLAEGYIFSRPRKGFYVSDLGSVEPVEKELKQPGLMIGERTDIPGSTTGGCADAKSGLTTGERTDAKPGSTTGECADAKSRSATGECADAKSGSATGECADAKSGSTMGERADAKVRQEKVWLADFTSNQTPPDSFPFSTWARLTREVLSERREELMRNAPPGGIRELRTAIARHLRAFRGIEVSPEQIIVGAGTEYLYGLLIQLLGFDRIYAAENPGYRKVSDIFASYRVKHCLVDLDRSGLLVEQLTPRQVDVVHVTPSHHFPTGITMPAARRYELLRWAAQAEGRYIIEDDYDSEFRMSGRPLPALFGMDRAGRVIYMNTFTRSLASTIRVSYMVLPRQLSAQFSARLSFYSSTVSNSTQYTLAAFLDKGYFEKHINRMRTASRKKRDAFLLAIRESGLGESAAISEQDAGLHFLMNLALKGPSQPLLVQLERQGIRMIQLQTFLRGEQAQDALGTWRVGDGDPDHTFLMNYTSIPIDQLVEAVYRMAETLRQMEGGEF